MNSQRIEEIREFLNQPDDVYEEAPMIALELLEVVDGLHAALIGQDVHWAILSMHHPHLVGVQRDDIREALGLAVE